MRIIWNFDNLTQTGRKFENIENIRKERTELRLKMEKCECNFFLMFERKFGEKAESEKRQGTRDIYGTAPNEEKIDTKDTR